MDQEVNNLEQLLDRIEQAAEGERVSLDQILDQVGRRSFGPMLLLAGLITLMPVIGDIPGMPSLMGLMVLVTAGQLLFKRDHFWLPEWLLRRSVAKKKLCKGLGWLRKPASKVDKVLHARLGWFTRGPGLFVIALTCCSIALAMTPMELVPFSANGAGLALAAFGLALIAHDGLVAVIALLITAATFGVVLYVLL